MLFNNTSAASVILPAKPGRYFPSKYKFITSLKKRNSPSRLKKRFLLVLSAITSYFIFLNISVYISTSTLARFPKNNKFISSWNSPRFVYPSLFFQFIFVDTHGYARGYARGLLDFIWNHYRQNSYAVSFLLYKANFDKNLF